MKELLREHNGASATTPQWRIELYDGADGSGNLLADSGALDMIHADAMADIFAEPLPARPATLKSGWKMPAGSCPTCGKRLVGVAVHDGAGDSATIGAFLECPDQCVDPVDVEWPFAEDLASLRDFERLGFETVVA